MRRYHLLALSAGGCHKVLTRWLMAMPQVPLPLMDELAGAARRKPRLLGVCNIWSGRQILGFSSSDETEES
jgi:hypothetical protein